MLSDRADTVMTLWENLHENRWLYWPPLLAYAGLIFYMSSIPYPSKDFPGLFDQLNDKVIHFVEYGVLGVLCYRVCRWALGPWCAARAVSLAITAAVLYGVSDELHQTFVPPRSGDVFDLIADAMGAAVAVFTWRKHTESEKYSG